MPNPSRALVAGCLFAGLLAAAARARPEVPAVVTAEPLPEWEAKFAGKEGWLGGDGVYSVALGPRRVLWLFGDTIFGTAKDGRRTDPVMVNNTVGVQGGQGKDGAIRFVAGTRKDGKPSAFFTTADGKGWLWPQAGVRTGDRLYVFLLQIENAGSGGPFGFRMVGGWLAVVENPDDEPEAWRVTQHRVPFASFAPGRERSWGSALLAEGGDVYVFGCDETRGKGLPNKRLTLARVAGTRLEDFAAWRFRTAAGWGEEPAAAAPLADGLANECSVTRLPGRPGYAAVYTEGGLSDRVVGRFADAPEGPWSAPVLLYRCPEMAKDKGVFCYAAKAHPRAAAGDELVVSYCVNAWKFARLFDDERVYRPKFVRVRLRPAG